MAEQRRPAGLRALNGEQLELGVDAARRGEAAALAAASSESPGRLADRVASPGGMTREGLDVLDRGGALTALVTETLRAACDRGAELAAAARGQG